MGLNETRRSSDKIRYRRQVVARLRLRGDTVTEIQDALASPDINITNLDTGRPYSRGTIANDLKHIRAMWRESATADMTEHKASQLAELREARRAVWRDSDHSEVRQNLALEIKLLGTAAPERLETKSQGTIVLDWGDDRTTDDTPTST